MRAVPSFALLAALTLGSTAIAQQQPAQPRPPRVEDAPVAAAQPARPAGTATVERVAGCTAMGATSRCAITCPIGQMALCQDAVEVGPTCTCRTTE